MEKMYQVFVSSTYEDLKEERNEVIKVLLELNCFPATMENFPAADDDQWTYIKRLIKSCDYYIVIIGGRYGTELPCGTSYTEREYKYAVENNIPVLAFLHHDAGKLPADKVDRAPDKVEKLEAFIALVGKKLRKTWRDKVELGGVVSRSLTVARETNPRVGYIRGDRKTSEHSELALKYLEIEREYYELKGEMIKHPKYYEDFDHAIPDIEGILNNAARENTYLGSPLKIRVLGVCFHKSFPLLRNFILRHAASGKRVEIRLSTLDRNSEIMGVLDDIWHSYYDVYEKQLESMIEQLKKIDGADITLKITKYSHMPNWHGILINKTHLFLSSCLWSSDKKMTAGENHYGYYKKGASGLHDRKAIQFKRWFDYSRFNGTVKKENQLVVDTKNGIFKKIS
ncbi:MAG: DUF4062 domain-containing protein [Gammaproteobacteria bacterium]|nr:DUF4062 domain-containing protein [Gammaproteobacteria bacterium]